MVKLTDSHAHIYLPQFDKDRDDMMERCGDAGVERILMPNVDEETIDAMMESEERYKGRCISMMGLHPCSVDRDFEKRLYVVEEWLSKRPFIAVGEIGTDLYWDKTYWEQQQEALKVQLEWARQKNLPVVLHCRESIDETIALVAGRGRKELPGIFHCFTGTLAQAEKIVEMGYMLGIGGVATFKNGRLDDVLRKIPLESMVLETDSPYLAPEPHRGKRNEPPFMRLVADKIAKLRSADVSEVARITTENCNTIFGLHDI